MASTRSVVVEFVGLPASGKTYVANRVEERLEQAVSPAGRATRFSVRTATERREGYYTRFTPGRHALERFALDPAGTISSMRTIRASDQPNWRYELRYLGYLLYVVEEIRRSRRSGEVFLADQGFFQHLWRIHLTGGADSLRSLTELAETHLDTVAPDIVVFVSVDHQTRMERAIERGTSVDAELLDPNHPLIAEDRDAYEEVRAFVPMVANELGHDLGIIDIENTADRLEENVESIVKAILTVRDVPSGVSLSSGGNPSGPHSSG